MRKNLSDKFSTITPVAIYWVVLVIICLVPLATIKPLYGQPGTVTIQQTIYLPNGQPARGSISLRMNASCIAPPTSNFVYGGTVNTIQLTNAGLFTVTLVPNVDCSPQTAYFATYRLTDSKGNAQPYINETWYVPAEPDTTTITAVRTAVIPAIPVTLSLSQLTGASLGDVFYGNSSGGVSRLSGNVSTAIRFLSQTGTGSGSAAPVWGSLIDGSISIDDCLKWNGTQIVSAGQACGVGGGGGGGGDVPSTRLISTSLPLTGGGDLSANRTLTCPTCIVSTTSYSNPGWLTGVDWSKVLNAPSTWTPASHSHVISDTTNLQTTLDGKSAIGHSHVIADTTNLQTTLDGKAAASHAHIIGDTTGLQTALDAKQASSSILTELANTSCSNGDSFVKSGGVWTCSSNTTLGYYVGVVSSSNPWTITGATHLLASCDLSINVYTVSGSTQTRVESSGFTSIACNQTTNDVTITFSGGNTAGRVVLIRGGGGGTGASNYTLSFTGQTSVTLAHNTGNKTVITQCFRSSDDKAIQPDDIQNGTVNNTTVTFASATTGYCNVSSGGVSGGGGGGSGTGDVVGPSSASLDELPLFNNVDGKHIGRSNTKTGIPYLTNGVVTTISGTATNCVKVNGTSGACGGGSITLGNGLTDENGPVEIDPDTVPSKIYFVGAINFGSIAQSTCLESTINVPGATIGDDISPGWPHTLETGLVGIMRVTASNTVTVRLCKITSGSVDPADQNFAGKVLK